MRKNQAALTLTPESVRLLRMGCRILLVAAAGMMMRGCEKLFDQKDSDALNMAREKEKEGDYTAAVQWYEASLDGTAKTAESHYSMALIFDDKLENPVAALDHFRRYLELTPHGDHAKDAESFAKQDEFKLVNSLSSGNFMPQQDAARLKNQNFELQQQLTDVRKQIADIRTEATAARATPGKNGKAPDAMQKPIPAGSKTYRVEPGDTLRSISRKFFKTPNRWEDIQELNFDTIGGTVKLKIGQNLMIPKS